MERLLQLRNAPEDAKSYTRNLRQHTALGLRGAWHALMGQENLEDRLDEIRVPTLIIVGERDPLLAPSRIMQQRIAGCRFVLIKDSGHGTVLGDRRPSTRRCWSSSRTWRPAGLSKARQRSRVGGAVPMAVSTPQNTTGIWSPSPSLSPRVRRLREEFFSFAARDYFRNEVRPYGSGTPWDQVWSPYNWGVVPEIYPMFDAVSDSLLAAAETVPLPAGFWDEPLVVRRALFFREVVERCLPVKILEGELIVGSYFNTALSKAHTRAEARTWQQGVRRWRENAGRLNDSGVGNCGAIPGHLIPNYPKVLRLGFRRIAAELEEMRAREPDATKRDFLRALIICLRSRCRPCRTVCRRSRTAGARGARSGAAARIGGDRPHLPPGAGGTGHDLPGGAPIALVRAHAGHGC